ncbi:fucose 4-O-acetylase-like acetyltransferase [Agromyces ramosus]|uniref:Fucose 4-O-acetylase-like acetyltransferase n=1 Tax=Agromyces ramosus TaxID=33879 RepID=A0A4Q7MF78_9MICO|nr:acyltransferase [Agromyces ramosus]RZS66073.1 fucose 4-O-acetylase-like acetyltransferase [Agromyces ramosus]
MSESSATRSASPMPGRTARDPVMDLVRVLCVVVVVIGHMLMIGAAVVPGRGLVVERTLLETSWIGPVTWIAQIMPLFFVVGGFVGIGAWRRIEASGGTAADFIRSRILRLARPSIALFAALAVAVLVMHLTGVDPESIRLIGIGITSPLWFLAAYSFAQAYLPGLATFHARAPWWTLATLVAGAVACDVLRFATGFEALGLLDMTFVWLFAQQLGFWIADGWFRARSPATVAAIGAGAYLVLFGLVGIGYSGNMLDNLYPPTFAIVALALGQTCLMLLAHPALTRLMALRSVQVVVATVGSRMMTIYLWHVPVLALVIGLLLLTPLPTPAAGSAAWWWTRPVVFVAVVVVLAAISALFGRLERPSPIHHPSDWATGLAAACMVIPSFALLAWGLDFLVAASSALILAAAVLLMSPLPARVRERGPTGPTAVTP